MLGITQPPNWMKIVGRIGSGTRAFHWETFQFINNEFFGADGAAFKHDGVNITIRNNLFEYNDWSGHMSQVNRGGLAVVISSRIGDRFIRNTIAYNGAAAGYRPWDTPYMEFNQYMGSAGD